MRLRLNIRTGEVEVECPEDFLDTAIQRVGDLATLLSPNGRNAGEDVAVPPPHAKPADPESRADADKLADLPPSFGEWLHKLPNDAPETEKALYAGYYVQLGREDKAFTTREVTELLQEHSVKLGNPSRAIQHNVAAKKCFILSGKDGKERSFRVMKPAEGEIREHLGVNS